MPIVSQKEIKKRGKAKPIYIHPIKPECPRGYIKDPETGKCIRELEFEKKYKVSIWKRESQLHTCLQAYTTSVLAYL